MVVPAVGWSQPTSNRRVVRWWAPREQIRSSPWCAVTMASTGDRPSPVPGVVSSATPPVHCRDNDLFGYGYGDSAGRADRNDAFAARHDSAVGAPSCRHAGEGTAAVAGQHDLVGDASPYEAQPALPLVQPAGARADIALHPPVGQGVPVPGGHGVRVVEAQPLGRHKIPRPLPPTGSRRLWRAGTTPGARCCRVKRREGRRSVGDRLLGQRNSRRESLQRRAQVTSRTSPGPTDVPHIDTARSFAAGPAQPLSTERRQARTPRGGRAYLTRNGGLDPEWRVASAGTVGATRLPGLRTQDGRCGSRRTGRRLGHRGRVRAWGHLATSSCRGSSQRACHGTSGRYTCPGRIRELL
jgi:hypothetical protein